MSSTVLGHFAWIINPLAPSKVAPVKYHGPDESIKLPSGSYREFSRAMPMHAAVQIVANAAQCPSYGKNAKKSD